MAQSDARPTGDYEVVGSFPGGSGNTFSWSLIMKYFYGHFFPSADSRSTGLEDKHVLEKCC